MSVHIVQQHGSVITYQDTSADGTVNKIFSQTFTMAFEFFLISISARSSRSDKSKSELPHYGVAGIEYLLRYTGFSQHWLLKITITRKIQIVIILKNSTLYLSDLTDLPILLIVKTPDCFRSTVQTLGNFFRFIRYTVLVLHKIVIVLHYLIVFNYHFSFQVSLFDTIITE